MRTARLKIQYSVLLAVLLFCQPGFCQETQNAPTGYHRAPQAIVDVLDAPPTPAVSVSPGSDYMLTEQRIANPPVSDLAQPMLRLAGLRINPATNGRYNPIHFTGLHLIRIRDGNQQTIHVPKAAYLGFPQWAPDGKHFAFTNTTQSGIELWVVDVRTGTAHIISNVWVNSVFDDGLQWMPDNHTLLVECVPATRGKPPENSKTGDGPIIQESDGRPAPAVTLEDLLTSAHDEDLFDYYTAAQLELIDILNGHVRLVGKPAVFVRIDPSPDGKHILTAQIHRPYSYVFPFTRFPKNVRVWSLGGALEFTLANLPLQEHIPVEGVATGPRRYEWVPNQPATLMWIEALDNGDTRAKIPFHDHLMTLDAPFKTKPVELLKLEKRFSGLIWGERGTALVEDYDRDRRWVRTFMVDAAEAGKPLRLIWDRSARDRYHDPGIPVMRRAANGKLVMWQSNSSIFLMGPGATPQGDVPFLDRFDLQSLKTERIFQSSGAAYEEVLTLASADGLQFITRYESPTEPPNYFLRDTQRSVKRTLTSFPDPAPQLHGISRQLVTYKRNDGVPLSFTLYLPPEYKNGHPLPTILWAYPLEFNDADTAGQVSGSPYRFNTITGASHLFLLTQGYAVLDNAGIPVIGSPDTVNNTFIEQIVASAKAAIDKAVEMGVADPNHIGVGGHSYGAFMAANLLAHSDLFRAGVAQSGAYNRTLTPFGFQAERRTLWQAPEMYLKVSPFMYADKIKYPLLLIHGMADDNGGTFPFQSERMYQAIKGNGGLVRYVQLPYESHRYTARESVEETLFEMIDWFDRWVKNAPPAAPARTQQADSANK